MNSLSSGGNADIGTLQIISAEAFPGKPFGVGKVVFRISEADRVFAETGSFDNHRSGRPHFLSSLLGGDSGSDSGRRATVAGYAKHDLVSVSRCTDKLQLELLANDSVEFELEPREPRRRIFRTQAWRGWWREFNKAFQSNDDYPAAFEVYLTSMIGKRLGRTPTARSLREQNPDPFRQTLELMFEVESVRARAIRDLMNAGVEPERADQRLPTDCRWQPCPIAAPVGKPKIERLAECVPTECFYLRFGNWNNQVWLKQLMAEYGGDMSRMVQLRGYEFPGQDNMLAQLSLESSRLDDLLGGNVVRDVAFIGSDFYVNDGAAIGVMFESSNGLFVSNLQSRRKAIAKAGDSVTLEEIEIAGVPATFLSTVDNQTRSFLISHKNVHLVTNCRYLAKRFVEASKGDRRLADHPEFQHARVIYPLERDDTVFAFFPAEFFHRLLSPQYQIELRRRSTLMAEVQMFQLAALIAAHEGLPEDVDVWISEGLLPKHFGFRVDGSKIDFKDGTYFDSFRGRRGYFVPIPDVELDSVTQTEADWYHERRAYYEKNLRRFDPLFGTIKRFELKNNVERLVFEARLAPFGEQKYGWLASILGPESTMEITQAPNDAVRFQAALQGGMLFPRIEPHQVFVSIQDDTIPESDLRPTNLFDLFKTLKTTPGYLGAYPKPGYLDILPQLGGQPDENGYTYSRLLKLWRLQFDEFSLLSFEQRRLEDARDHLKAIDAKRQAQIRLDIADLTNTRLKDWVNSLNYQRSWQTSMANVRLINTLINQFGVPPEQAKAMSESVLGVNLVCNLGGPYSMVKSAGGRSVWQSESWPDFSNPRIPKDYLAPILAWFRGGRLEVKKNSGQFVTYGWIDIQRKPVESAGLALPKFNMFKGFGKVEPLPSKKDKSDRDKKEADSDEDKRKQ